MASVILENGYFALASDLADLVVVPVYSVSENAAGDVETRRYASGRFRLIRRPGVQRIVSVTLQLAPRSDVDRLRDWVGEVVLFRDPRGRRLWATFASIGVGEHQGPNTGFVDAELTLAGVTVSEVV
jgi:hypothetical protein